MQTDELKAWRKAERQTLVAVREALDLPVVGLLTLETLKACGVSCLAVEAGSTILLDRDALLAAFSGAQIAMVGVTPPAA